MDETYLNYLKTYRDDPEINAYWENQRRQTWVMKRDTYLEKLKEVNSEKNKAGSIYNSKINELDKESIEFVKKNQLELVKIIYG